MFSTMLTLRKKGEKNKKTKKKGKKKKLNDSGTKFLKTQTTP